MDCSDARPVSVHSPSRAGTLHHCSQHNIKTAMSVGSGECIVKQGKLFPSIFSLKSIVLLRAR